MPLIWVAAVFYIFKNSPCYSGQKNKFQRLRGKHITHHYDGALSSQPVKVQVWKPGQTVLTLGDESIQHLPKGSELRQLLLRMPIYHQHICIKIKIPWNKHQGHLERNSLSGVYVWGIKGEPGLCGEGRRDGGVEPKYRCLSPLHLRH